MISATIFLSTPSTDAGPSFNIYSNTDGYVNAFATGISKSTLLSGYFTSAIPDNTTIVKLESLGPTCTNYINIIMPTSTSTSTSTSTTTTSTTAMPCTQSWATKNLDVTTYSDGTIIPQVTDPTAWENLTTGAWCYYNNDPSNGDTYGKLYNWYAVAGIHDNDPNTPNKKLAPEGYHIPTDAEWTTLTTCLEGTSVAGGKMKSTGTIQLGTGLWNTPNTDATNESGFTALPGGIRFYFGSFNYIGNRAIWWSSSEFNTAYAWNRELAYNYGDAFRSYNDKPNGFSVRCIKD